MTFVCQILELCARRKTKIEKTRGMAGTIFQTKGYKPSVQLSLPSGNTNFPVSLGSSDPLARTDDIIAAATDLRATGQIQSLLDRHGAIYFQNLRLKDAHEFSKFAHAFGWSPHEVIGNPVRRTVLAKNVATANEGPNTQHVYPHNEFGLSPHYPAYVLFYCISAPDSGVF